MRVRIDNAGAIGVVEDIPGYELPGNAWTAAQNVRMQDGAVKKARGYAASFTTPQVAPYTLIPVLATPAYYWLYAGANKVFAAQSAYHFDITRPAQYSANDRIKWNHCNLGGVIVLNNRSDVPQYWPFPSSHTNKLEDLPNWPSTDRARVISSYKNFLVAGNVTRSGVQYPTMVKWSHGADIGSVPSSWAIDDPTLDSGENLLPQSGGNIQDIRPLRDISVIYRTESTWGMQYIGAPAIFRFWGLFDTSGILGGACAEEFFGSHFVVTQDDLIVHDGQSIRSVANNKVRRAFFADVGVETYDRSFVVHNRTDKEMWVCYPSTASTGPCDSAYVWCYSEDTWAKRDLPDVVGGAFGVVDASSVDAWEDSQGPWSGVAGSWASASGSWESSDNLTWDEDDEPWDYRAYSNMRGNVLLAAASSIYEADTSNTNDGASMTAYVERRGLALIGGNKVDLYARKQVRAIYPHIEGTTGGVVKVYVGSQDVPNGTVTYAAAKDYTIGTSYKVDFNVDGRLIAVKFESTTDIEWSLHGYELDMEVSGSA